MSANSASHVNSGFDPLTGAILWSEPRELGFAFDPLEVTGGTELLIGEARVGWIDGEADGVDDDGDGLVDEGVLYYRTTGPAGAAVVTIVARDVLPTSSFRFESMPTATTPNPVGDAVRIRMEVAHRQPDAGASARVDTSPERFIIRRIDSTASAIIQPESMPSY